MYLMFLEFGSAKVLDVNMIVMEKIIGQGF